MKRIYLDYASLTPIDKRVLAEINKYSAIEYANPSSFYKEGVAALGILKESRKRVASFLRALPDEIIFTSGGTEANALALEGVGRAAHRSGFTKPHMIISNIEHSSIIEVAHMLEKQGVEVTRISVGSNGLVSVDDIKNALKPETFLVSIMYVNNEVGTVQPIREIAKVIRQYRNTNSNSIYPLFHTDAAQAALFMDMNVDKLGVDLLTLDAGKVYGPRGIGCLYIKRETPIEPIIYGGGQENGLRSGTENIPAIAGFAKALDLVEKEKDKERIRITELREYFLKELKKIRSNIILNSGDSNTQTSSHIISVSIPDIDNEFFLFQLDAKGIAVSTKSSCLRDEEDSYVLKAIGANNKTSIRFSFGRWTKKGDIRYVIKIIKKLLSNN